jgi:HAD superfamily hydrolase (TIGR01549 family)
MSSGLPFIFLDIGATLIHRPDKGPASFLQAELGLDNLTRKRLDRFLLTTDLDGPQALAAALAGTFGVRAAGLDALAARLWHDQETAPEEVPGGRDLIATFTREGVPFGFISNIWRPYFSGFLRVYGDAMAARPRALSHEVGFAKPDPRLYEAALERVRALPPDAIMVGDSYDKDIAPALAIGMLAVWVLHRPDQEAPHMEAVRRGIAARPTLTLNSIADLAAAELAAASPPASRPMVHSPDLTP